MRDYKSSDLQNYNFVCSTAYNKLEIKTYIKIDSNSNNYKFDITLCTENNEDNVDIGLRNL